MESQNIKTSKGIVWGQFFLAGFHVSRKTIVAKEAAGQRSLLKAWASGSRFLPIFHCCSCFGGSRFQQPFLFLPEKFISGSGFGPPPWGGSRRKAGGAVGTPPSTFVSLFCLPLPCPAPKHPSSPSAFPCSVSSCVWESCGFVLPCDWGSFCVIKCCHVVLDLGRFSVPHSSSRAEAVISFSLC